VRASAVFAAGAGEQERAARGERHARGDEADDGKLADAGRRERGVAGRRLGASAPAEASSLALVGGIVTVTLPSSARAGVAPRPAASATVSIAMARPRRSARRG
jgi:hypothetical protein